MKRIVWTLLTLCLVGCSGKSSLRVDDLVFGNQRTGLQTENPTFRGGETVYLGYNIRGMSPDASGNAKLSFSVTFADERTPLVEQKNVVFKVNSESERVNDPETDLRTF